MVAVAFTTRKPPKGRAIEQLKKSDAELWRRVHQLERIVANLAGLPDPTTEYDRRVDARFRAGEAARRAGAR